MIIAFFGHADFQKTAVLEQKLLALLEDVVGESAAEFYLGGYGGFDNFAYRCGRSYQKMHPLVSLVFVTPYPNPKSLEHTYDLILYPALEARPKRFSILYRNQYMVEKADCIISYVAHSWGGAYTAISYAEKRHKKILNLACI